MSEICVCHRCGNCVSGRPEDNLCPNCGDPFHKRETKDGKGGTEITQADLDAMPENGEIGQIRKEIEGKVVMVPVLLTAYAMYQPPDEPMGVIDKDGVEWMIGYIRGVRHKSRTMQRGR